MEISQNIKTTERLNFAYFATAFIFLLNEIFKFHPYLVYFGQLRLFSLVALYLYTSQVKNKIYLGVLVFVITSNILFLKKTNEFLAYGMVAYLLNRLLTVILVYKSISEKKAVPILLASLPFLFFYIYMTLLSERLYSIGFFALFLNGIFMSFLGGLALYNYYFENEDYKNKNALLLVSIILFVMQNLIFVLQKYFDFTYIFEPISILVNTAGLYIFYKYVILSEEFKLK